MNQILAHWSPDGSRIAFAAAVPGKPWKIFLVGRDGGSTQAVTSEEVTETDPTWSADGKVLAFGIQTADSSMVKIFEVETRKISQLAGSDGILRRAGRPTAAT